MIGINPPTTKTVSAAPTVSPIVEALSVQNGFCVLSKNAKLRHPRNKG
jgi:hypothetical protein